MGIDQIGKKGPPLAPPAGEVATGRAGETGRAFEMPAAGPTPSAAPAAPLDAPRTALARLHAGEVDTNGYIDLKVHEATAHLAGLPAPALQAIRVALRDRMAADPTLVELVGTAARPIPEPRGDDG
jgi:hypothetical protein